MFLIPGNAGNKGIQQTIKRIDGKRYIVEPADSYALIENVLLVKLNPIVEEIPKELNIVNSNKLGFLYVSVPEGIDIEDYADILKKDDRFDIVEFLGETKCCFVPNDSLYTNQWHIGKIKLNDAWNITTGNSNIKVAVIDTGVDAGHYDLGYGNDTYSHVSTTLGYDYTGPCAYQTPTFFHGTYVAGVLGAKTNNSVGISGVSGGNNSAGIAIIPYCLGNSGSFVSDYDANAILAAVEAGVDIINISMSMPQTSDVTSAIEYAYYHDINIVCAAGNNAPLLGIVFPASNQYTIAVGATDQNDQRCSFSKYGAGLDIVAPGKDIYSTNLNNLYGIRDENGYYNGCFEGFDGGTSFSAPQVSGVIALMLSVNPNLTTSEIRTILRNTAKKVSGYTYTNGWNQEVGYGRLDAYEAVKAAFKINVTGADMVCSQEIYNLGNMPADNMVTLNATTSTTTDICIQVSPNLSIYSYSNKYLTVNKLYNGNGYIRVYYKGNLIAEKKVWVGAPVITNVHKDGMMIYIETDVASQTYDNSYYLLINNNTYPIPGGMFSLILPHGTYNAEAYASNACGESDPYYTQIVIGNNFNFNVSNILEDGLVTITRVNDNGELLSRDVLEMEDKNETVPYILTNSLTGKVVARGNLPITGGVLDFSRQSKGVYALTLSPKEFKEQTFKIALK